MSQLVPSRASSRKQIGRTVETWDAIRARRNVRTYTDDRIPGADLDQEGDPYADVAGDRQRLGIGFG